MTKKELINSSDYVVDKAVKIAGTNYDRRRKVTSYMRKRMIEMYESGKTIHSISDRFGVSYDAVKRAVNSSFNESEKKRKNEVNKRYNYRVEYSRKRMSDRANYKRQLLMENRRLITS